MTDARTAMLGRLKSAPRSEPPPLPAWTPPPVADRLGRFRQAAEAWRAEVREVAEADWPAALKALLAAKGAESLLCPPDFALEGVQLVPYDRPVEDMKETLLHGVAAGVTWAAGAVAETGTVMLSPAPEAPRLMSLLPPLHVVLLRAADICDTLPELMARRQGPMPTNLLLITGPSKTADIEQTLAFGVHGPKELVVMVVG